MPCEDIGKKSCARCTDRRQSCKFDGDRKGAFYPRGANRLKKSSIAKTIKSEPGPSGSNSRVRTRKLTKEMLEHRDDQFGQWVIEGLGALYGSQQPKVCRDICNDMEIMFRVLRRGIDAVIDEIDNERRSIVGATGWEKDVGKEQDERVARGEQSSASDIIEEEGSGEDGEYIEED